MGEFAVGWTQVKERQSKLTFQTSSFILISCVSTLNVTNAHKNMLDVWKNHKYLVGERLCFFCEIFKSLSQCCVYELLTKSTIFPLPFPLTINMLNML